MTRIIIIDNMGIEELRDGKKYALYDDGEEYIIDDDGRKRYLSDLTWQCKWQKV